MLKKLLIFVVVFITSLQLNGCDDIDTPSLQQDNKFSGYVQLSNFPENRLLTLDAINTNADNSTNWVSIAQYDHDHYVIANYSSLMLFNRKTASVCPLSISGGEFISAYDKEDASSDKRNKITFNPAGVVIDENKRLYVANYNGNNILSFLLNVPDCSASLIDEYTSQQSGGPENVAVNNDKQILVSANYIAGTVTAFSLETKKQLWSVSVPQAHGITISKDVSYATGLTERKIYEIDLDSGKILRSAGEVGWDPLKGQFLWPTSIFNDGESGLILSDAHTGFVSKIDKKTLLTSHYFGGNGPSYQRFNFPYTAAVFGDELFVMSSMRNQILILDKHNLSIKEGFAFKADPWLSDESFTYDFKRDWVGYVNHSESDRLKIAGKEYMFGYGHLHPVLPGPVMRAPNAGTLLNPESYLYFIMGTDRDWGGGYFSPSGTSLVTIIRSDVFPDLVYRIVIPRDSWMGNGSITLGDGTNLNESAIAEKTRNLRKAFDDIYKKHGWMAIESFLDAMDFDRDYSGLGVVDSAKGRDKANELLKQVFVTQSGSDFFQLINGCTYKTCEAKKLYAAAEKYFDYANKQAYVNFDEYMLVSMLSGLRPPTDKIDNYHGVTDYSNCGDGKYYPGFGINALESKGYDDYLSAVDLQSSVVCFRTLKNQNSAKQSIMQIGWLSVEEIPESFEIFEIKGSGKPFLIKSIKSPEVLTSGGLPYSVVTLDKSKTDSTLMLKLKKGGAQDRLMLRSLFLH